MHKMVKEANTLLLRNITGQANSLGHKVRQEEQGKRNRFNTFRIPPNVMFHGEMHDNIIMRKDKKTFFAAARLFWPEGRFWDFFGLLMTGQAWILCASKSSKFVSFTFGSFRKDIPKICKVGISIESAWRVDC